MRKLSLLALFASSAMLVGCGSKSEDPNNWSNQKFLDTAFKFACGYQDGISFDPASKEKGITYNLFEKRNGQVNFYVVNFVSIKGMVEGKETATTIGFQWSIDKKELFTESRIPAIPGSVLYAPNYKDIVEETAVKLTGKAFYNNESKEVSYNLLIKK